MFESTVYSRRRQALRKGVKSGLILILGHNEAPANYMDNTYKFRQNSSFIYFFGHERRAGLAGVLDVDAGEDYFFGNDVDMDDIVWMGPQPSIKELAAQSGIEKSFPLKELKNVVARAIAQGRPIHFTPQYRAENQLLLEDLTGIRASVINQYASVELIKAIVALRSKKEAREIKLIDEACNIGACMHMLAIKDCTTRSSEKTIAALVEFCANTLAYTLSFPSIVSIHGETLHNHVQDGENRLVEGRFLVVDAGCELPSGYCSDNTRSTPVNHKFDSRQKDVYSIVLRCHDQALELARPGVTYLSVHKEICRTLAQGLKDLGLMKGDVAEAVEAGAHALFMPHGLGHMMGLDVHDMEDLGQQYVGYDDEVRPSTQFGLASLRMGRRLKPGFVVTDEPGCYFIPALIDKWRAEGLHKEFLNYEAIEKFKDFGGIRLEDDLLITPKGARFLGTRRIPITIEEIEAFEEK
jgi:Xaa-Pro aminopeptidase